MMFVANATCLDCRRDDESMRGHRGEGATPKIGASRRNPLGGGGLWVISLSLFVDNALHHLLLSPRPHLPDPLRKPHRIYGREHLKAVIYTA